MKNIQTGQCDLKKKKPGQEDFISGQEGLQGTGNFITCKLKPS